jgi:hypothetical protein
MADMVSGALIERIKRRLADDWRRTGEGDWQRTPPERRARRESPGMIGGLLQSIVDSRLINSPPEALKPLRPLNEKDVAKVEASLGFRLPESLRSLYLTIGDGNFGPYFGIRRLSNWARDYQKLRTDLREERGHEWPEALLPLVFLNGRRVCLDRHSGEVIFWDRPAKRCSIRKWDASFVRHSATLEEWLERWVDTPTSCEGGPAGGWTPPEGEVQRRAEIAGQREQKQAAANERAARIEFGQHPAIDEALLQRICERAGDPQRRSGLAGMMEQSEPVDLDAMSRQVEADEFLGAGLKEQLGGMARRAGFLSRMVGKTGLRVSRAGPGFVMGFDGAGGALGRPATSPAVAKAEGSLGFTLPEPLRQLYDLADGGFGPGPAGLMPLSRMAKLYRQYTGNPQGPNGEPWPARLLPIAEDDPAVYCLDLSDGSIVVHDVQDMDHLGHGQWARSFRREAPSLSSWFDHWLGTPTHAEESASMMRDIQARAEARPPSPVTGFPVQLDDPAQQAEAEISFLSHAPSLRLDFGLPETGWEAEVRRRHGVG